MKSQFIFLPTFLLLLVVCSSSCCEAVFEISTYLKNETQTPIELKIYDSAKVELLEISSLSTLKAPFLITSSDSIQVFYNKALATTHYSSTISSTKNSSGILHFSDSGNLYNRDSYTIDKRELKCNGSITNSTYVFK